jgi:Arc/MetJ family transcription regulator
VLALRADVGADVADGLPDGDADRTTDPLARRVRAFRRSHEPDATPLR